jgi:hypothetical protein
MAREYSQKAALVTGGARGDRVVIADREGRVGRPEDV